VKIDRKPVASATEAKPLEVALYARVSTSLDRGRQDPDNQFLVLREYALRRGWRIAHEYMDDISAVRERPQYDEMLKAARRGRLFDAIVVVRLDRIFRSMEEFVSTTRRLHHWGIRFLCSDQPIDTDQRDPTGQLLMHVLAAVAEFERALISQRVRAGIERARSGGKKWGGRKRKVIDVRAVQTLRDQGFSLGRISVLVGCNRNLLGRTLKNSATSLNP
jgi:DNA invertase Pin-like site-specific DNA recombinase